MRLKPSIHGRWLIGTLLLTGCAVGPDYKKPDPVLPEKWSLARAKDTSLQQADEAVLSTWWESFHDSELSRLIGEGHSQNLDLKIAMTRIDSARSEQSANRAALFPKIGATADAARLSNLFPVGLPRGNNINYFLTGFDAIWEIDVFGRLRRKLEAAEAQTSASVEEYREAFLMLSAEIGRQYVSYRGLQQQAEILDQNLKLLVEISALSEGRYVHGLESRDTVEKYRALADSTAAELRATEARITTERHKIEALIGRKPDALKVRLGTTNPIPTTSERRLLTQPADTLRLRPDVRSAEFQLHSATAIQGAAIAELFPKISIAAFLGIRNSDLENLFKSSSFAWATGASVTQPIFNFGQIRAGIDLSDARQHDAYLQYEKTVLEALHEAETTLSEFVKEEQRKTHLVSVVRHLDEASRMAETRFKEGLGTRQDYLSSLVEANMERLQLLQSETTLATGLIAVFKAIGGAGQAPVELKEDPLRPWG